MKNFRLLLILSITLLVASSIFAQEKYLGVIHGQVVDEKGRPVSKASITFNVSDALRDERCWAKEHELLADGAGKFLIQEYCGVAARTVFIFTETTTQFRGAIFPISAPFWTDLRRTNPKFAGVPVKLEGNQQIDLGKIPVQVWYNLVELFVTDAKGRPFYKTEDDWSRFTLIVRDERGTAIGQSGLSNYDIDNHVRIDRASVRLALPEGTWTLELLRDLDDIDVKGNTRGTLAKTSVSIKKTDVCAQSRLVVK